MNAKLDMSMMFAMHNALRRELAQVGRIASRQDGDPGKLLHAALGWELFKKFLTVHHQTEDDALWPPLRAAVAGHPDQEALVDALEAEHAIIDPLLAAIDGAVGGDDRQRFGDIIEELSGKLTAHLAHEEADGLPLIDVSLTEAEWQHFSQVHGERILPDAPTYIPWLLAEASPQTLADVLGKLPPHLLATYRQQWAPSYAALQIWPAVGEPAA